MIEIENLKVYNTARAIYSARNAWESWDKSDSDLENDVVGEKDLALMKKLYKAGPEHAKFMRSIMVSFDMTTNHIVWAEFDTYKVGVVRNSCSKMHKIHVKEFEKDDFSHEGIDMCAEDTSYAFSVVLGTLEVLRQKFNKTQEKKYWRAMIELLPMGYNLKATITTNYAVLANIINQRRGHKMFEWQKLCGHLLNVAPFLKDIMGVEG